MLFPLRQAGATGQTANGASRERERPENSGRSRSNLSTGEHNIHSPLEWTCLEEMQTAVKVLVELVKVWGEAAVR